MQSKLRATPTTEEQHTITEASTALPDTTAAEGSVNHPSSPTSPILPSFPEQSSVSDKPSTNPAKKSIICPVIQYPIVKPADGTVPAPIDPNFGFAKVNSIFNTQLNYPDENFNQVEDLGVGQAAEVNT